MSVFKINSVLCIFSSLAITFLEDGSSKRRNL